MSELSTHATKVFVSYSTKDYDEAMDLGTRLQDEGFDVWVDKERMKNTTVIRESLGQSIQEADHVVFVVTDSAIESDWVREEFNIVWMTGKKFTPIKVKELKDHKLSDLFNDGREALGDIRCVDWSERLDETFYEEIIEDINPDFFDKNPPASIFSNAGFSAKTTFLLGGYWGLFVVLFYFLELIGLFVNPINVRGPDPTMGLLTIALAHSSDSDRWWSLMLDVASWLTDYKKLWTFGIIGFWFFLFARFTCRHSKRPIRMMPSPLQHRAVESLFRRRPILPFFVNVVLAVVFACFFSPAAMLPPALRPDGNTSIYQFFISDNHNFQNFGFLFYRILNPILMFLFGLHFLIGLQVLGRPPKGTSHWDALVARFAKVAAVAFLFVIIIEQLLRTSLNYFAGCSFDSVVAQRVVGLILFMAAIIAFLFHRSIPDYSNKHYSRPIRIFKCSLWPIAFFGIPTLIIFFVLRPHVTNVPAPAYSSIGAGVAANKGLEAWAKKNQCVTDWVVEKPKACLLSVSPENGRMLTTVVINEWQSLVSTKFESTDFPFERLRENLERRGPRTGEEECVIK